MRDCTEEKTTQGPQKEGDWGGPASGRHLAAERRRHGRKKKAPLASIPGTTCTRDRRGRPAGGRERPGTAELALQQRNLSLREAPASKRARAATSAFLARPAAAAAAKGDAAGRSRLITESVTRTGNGRPSARHPSGRREQKRTNWADRPRSSSRRLP